MGLSINKKVWQYILIVAALLFVVIAFLFYIKPVFIALVLGVLATVLLNKIIEIFNKATESCSSMKRKAIALVSSVSVVLVISILVFAGAMNLMANFNTVLDSLNDFTDQYNETAENMAEDITNITIEERQIVIPGEVPEADSENGSYKMTSDPPPASNTPLGIHLLSYELSTTNVIKSVLTSGGGIMSSTTETISFIGTTVFASCLIIPIMAGYYFKEKGNVRNGFISMIPDKYKDAVITTIRDITNDMGAYTLMKILEAFVIMFLYCAGFYVVGIPHWLFAGILMGLFNIAPYIGFILPAIPVTVYAYTLGTEVMLAVVGIVVVIQLFDFFFILPDMVMKTVKVSSFTAVILTLAGLKIAGVFGLVFAVPLYIFCKIILHACYKMLVSMYPDPTDPNEVYLDEG
ncbi:AI-2E family transporter [Methanimicrococcus blatticola]|uniref:Putative PurR-regulated permease PerM n=1 Tax=Methanimicrococcus blatticola TaxID=91560 RepID=A0A484F388_9EURY|nr:AI-2E family transporter [Methanimicrococcus blatticola]MBZ3936404.1 AI-2E family transporter [Methanimicrococcus blatticola]MCC2509566.1 AI-2E family transporter [Methanimicrococcus blatticola]TDQ67615.1 putative PurR-regulated permease PerM [Methanimicrococcus blatticola]